MASQLLDAWSVWYPPLSDKKLIDSIFIYIVRFLHKQKIDSFVFNTPISALFIIIEGIKKRT